MMKLLVFYDQDCAFCRKCKNWLIRQPAYLELELLPVQARSVQMAYPELAEHDASENMIVISDTGLVYTGDDAWITILWALKDWRDWANRLQQPALRPLARQFWQLVSQNRYALSALLPEKATEEELREHLSEVQLV
ncbi:MAG: DUF393 domain-containing protein [Verrucomicrobiota bacterium JB022]|nr:DUF393 domain-containing protein [Verrucomicrobiota bacterium JB022]